MLQTMFQGHKPFGFGEDLLFKAFYPLWAWRPSWSCDLDGLNKLSFSRPKEALIQRPFFAATENEKCKYIYIHFSSSKFPGTPTKNVKYFTFFVSSTDEKCINCEKSTFIRFSQFIHFSLYQALHEIWLQSAQWFQRRRCLKMLTHIHTHGDRGHWWVRKPPRGPNNCMFWAMIEAEGEVGYPYNRFKPPSIFILTVQRRYFCCGSLLLLGLDVCIYTLVQLLC